MNRKRIRSRSAAFTLVELLVVITIIGMLVGLLLPAVQSAREAGRRAQCMNNQKNIALAMMNFEAAKGHFPGYLNGLTIGYGTPEDVGGGVIKTPVSSAPVSWVVTLLPYLDRRDVHDQYKNVLAGGGGPAMTEFAEMSLSILLCPSDPPEGPGPHLSYVVNRGINGRDNSPALGVCFDLSRAGTSKVSVDFISARDGTSTTLLLTESLLTPSGIDLTAATTSLPHLQLLAADGATTYHYRPISTWFDTAFSLLTWKRGDPKLVDGTECESRGELSLGFEWGAIMANETAGAASVGQVANSRHGGIIIASFADGHQSQIREDMDPNTFKHLMTPDSAAAAAEFGVHGPVGILSEGSM
ncbi:MAG: DUF1559 domain-containing protein [Pirellulaceae bacterium]|nr:DUF1559 domain-containing protein [Pirellulaceae bacterium]